jgi:type II secretory pathway pseudopilin PulG
VARGEQAALKNLADMLKGALAGAAAMLSAEKQRAKGEGDAITAAMMILASHHAQAAVTSLQPEVEDGELVVEVDLAFGDPAMFASLVGIGAAIAVPAFLNYIERAKQAEAQAVLAQLEVFITLHYVEHGTLPPSAPLTPADPSRCCGDGCAPDPSAWAHDSWRTLGFELTGTHRYAYEYERHDGDSFTLRALADLGCDGHISGFEKNGRVVDGSIDVGPEIRL